MADLLISRVRGFGLLSTRGWRTAGDAVWSERVLAGADAGRPRGAGWGPWRPPQGGLPGWGLLKGLCGSWGTVPRAISLLFRRLSAHGLLQGHQFKVRNRTPASRARWAGSGCLGTSRSRGPGGRPAPPTAAASGGQPGPECLRAGPAEGPGRGQAPQPSRHQDGTPQELPGSKGSPAGHGSWAGQAGAVGQAGRARHSYDPGGGALPL